MTQPRTPAARLRAGDGALVEAVGLSVNETHAFALGVAVGVLARRAGRPTVALAVAVWSLLGSGGAIGTRTLRREPWYALAGLVVGIVGGES